MRCFYVLQKAAEAGEGGDTVMTQTFMKEKKILPLVLSMSLPMVISMAVNSLYNIVDSFFVAKISEDGKFTAQDGYYEEQSGTEKEGHFWLIISDPRAWNYGVSEAKAVALTPENLTKYGPDYLIKEENLHRIKAYDIATRVMDGKTYVAVYLCLEKRPS